VVRRTARCGNVIQYRRCRPAAGISVPYGTRRGHGMATGDTPVMDTLIEINAASLARTELDVRSLMLVRLAALAAVDAPASSYLLHIEPAVKVGLTVEDAEDVLVAVAPIVGTPRTASAAVRILEALGLAIRLAEDAESARGA
jgi:alkylhydroperoxidase/carboxymuconolactone decarboxylase family protein YurZ